MREETHVVKREHSQLHLVLSSCSNNDVTRNAQQQSHSHALSLFGASARERPRWNAKFSGYQMKQARSPGTRTYLNVIVSHNQLVDKTILFFLYNVIFRAPFQPILLESIKNFFLKVSLELTGELNISSSRCLGSLPFFGLTSMQICSTSGRHRRIFSINTFPKNPVPPVTSILQPARVSAILSGATSSVLLCSITQRVRFFESFSKMQKNILHIIIQNWRYHIRNFLRNLHTYILDKKDDYIHIISNGKLSRTYCAMHNYI